MKLVKKIIATLFLCSLISLSATAEDNGTALSNDRDLLRIDAYGGSAFPSPGLSGGGTVLWTAFKADAFGLGVNFSIFDLSDENAKLVTKAYSAVWEHTIPVFEGYHAVRLRLGLGALDASKSMEKNVAESSGKKAHDSRIVPNANVSATYDIPMADLMWIRIGACADMSTYKTIPARYAILAGWVIGGQWFGIGD